jgi:hypothetical protein
MGHEIRRESGQLELLAANNIKGLLSYFSFIAPSLAATGFGAIILRSSLTGLRKTPGRHSLSLLARARINNRASPSEVLIPPACNNKHVLA